MLYHQYVVNYENLRLETQLKEAQRKMVLFLNLSVNTVEKR